MPVSNIGGKEWIAYFYKCLVRYANVKRVLDVGVGSGTYVSLYREENEEWIGVEVWEPYVEQYQLKDKYDDVIVADIRSLDLSSFPKFDVVFFGDILEHMTKEEAIAVVKRLFCFGRFVIISIPIEHMPQGEQSGNPYQAHVKDDWSDEEVRETFLNIAYGIVSGKIGVYVLAIDVADKASVPIIVKKEEKYMQQNI